MRNKEKNKKTIILFTFIVAGNLLFIQKVSAQSIPDEYPPEINLGDVVNSYKQPNDRSLHWDGSADASNNEIIILGEDVSAMQAGAQNYMADVDGDGIPSTQQDIILLQDYFNGNISYLPGWWNRLQTRAERESWLEKMLTINQTDTNTWVNGTIDERFISGNFAAQLALDFFGHNKLNPDDNDIPVKYDTTNIGRVNIPVYYVSIDHLGTNWGHGMNAILVGEDPLNFYDWCFVEPQNDSINVMPGDWNIPYNSNIIIGGMRHFNQTGSPDMPSPYAILGFNISETGEDSLFWGPREGLILERPDWISDFPEGLPTVGVDTRGFTGPTSFELYQNYPNPFNSATKIKYSLSKPTFITLTVYNLNGRTIRTLISDIKSPGDYQVQWNGTDDNGITVSTGIYLTRLEAGGQSDVIKMIYLR